MLTICLTTCRPEPKFDYFFDSLHRELCGDYRGVTIVIVDALLNQRPPNLAIQRSVAGSATLHCADPKPTLHWIEPKPNLWQGVHRLTSQDYWAKCNALNTALCYAPDGWFTVMDDLGVLIPGWGKALKRAMVDDKIITLGAYKKVKELEIEDGAVISFKPHLNDRGEDVGRDSRWSRGSFEGPVPAVGDMMFGHVTAPVEAFLKINGYPELLCDSLGFEDVITGITLEKAGYKFVYDRTMLVFESEELHHLVQAGNVKMTTVKRIDKGCSPKDKSNEVLRRARAGDYSIWNNYDLRELRQGILNGGEFPVPLSPVVDWYDGMALNQM
jgi:hypothetical protein